MGLRIRREELPATLECGGTMSQTTAPTRPSTREGLIVFSLLTAILLLTFLPAVLGNRTLLLSARDVPSILSSGAYGSQNVGPGIVRSPDPASSAWQAEPLLKVI